MNVSEFISIYRQSVDKEILSELIPFFAFKPVENEDGDLEDANLAFRTEIVEEILYDFSKTDHSLIKALFSEEIKCEEETWVHDNLHQLCFYLYTIGDLEDIFILYSAKYHATHMDAACVLDRDMITLGYDVDMVIEFVTNKFKRDPLLKERFSKILWVLNYIKTHTYHPECYTQFINQYFLGPKID